MTAHIFTSEADARKFAADIDARIGYPLGGLNCAGGIHAATQQFTTSHREVVKHPTRAQWAYEHDASTAGMVARADVTPLRATSAAKLADDWKPVAVAIVAEEIA